MRKNYKIAVITVAMAVMMAASACGSKNSPEPSKTETAAESGTTETTETTETKETAKDDTEEASSEEAKETSEEADETAEQKAAPEAGAVEGGVFKSASGIYQITVPEGWSIDGESDEGIAVFESADGSDILEITYVEGDDADGAREIYPETMEEYKELVSRGEDMEFVRYEVKNGDNGSQTFRYSIRYMNPEDGIRYYAVSGFYDAAAKKYVCAAGSVESEGDEAQAKIESALDSLSFTVSVK